MNYLARHALFCYCSTFSCGRLLPSALGPSYHPPTQLSKSLAWRHKGFCIFPCTFPQKHTDADSHTQRHTQTHSFTQQQTKHIRQHTQTLTKTHAHTHTHSPTAHNEFVHSGVLSAILHRRICGRGFASMQSTICRSRFVFFRSFCPLSHSFYHFTLSCMISVVSKHKCSMFTSPGSNESLLRWSSGLRYLFLFVLVFCFNLFDFCDLHICFVFHFGLGNFFEFLDGDCVLYRLILAPTHLMPRLLLVRHQMGRCLKKAYKSTKMKNIVKSLESNLL